MSGLVRPVLASWREAARKTAFFLLLVLGSAAAGFAIAWPLWFFATSARGPYTIFALLVASAGIVFVAVRGILRARRAPRERAGRRPLAALLAVVQVVVFVVGLYAVALLFFHGIWLFAVPVLVIWIGLLLLLGMARRARRSRSLLTSRSPSRPPGERPPEGALDRTSSRAESMDGRRARPGGI